MIIVKKYDLGIDSKRIEGFFKYSVLMLTF